MSTEDIQLKFLNLRNNNEYIVFIVVFFICSAFLFLMVNILSPFINTGLSNLTINSTVIFLKLLLVDYKVDGILLYINGFPLKIIMECSAVNYMILATSAIIALNFTIKDKVVIIALSNAVIFIVNIMRIVTLGIFGSSQSREVFDLFHNVLWEIFFPLITLAVIFAVSYVVAGKHNFSVKQPFKNLKDKLKAPSIIVLVCSSLLVLLSNFYFEIVRFVYNNIFHNMGLSSSLVFIKNEIIGISTGETSPFAPIDFVNVYDYFFFLLIWFFANMVSKEDMKIIPLGFAVVFIFHLLLVFIYALDFVDLSFTTFTQSLPSFKSIFLIVFFIILLMRTGKEKFNSKPVTIES